jgi:hypothetical protein
MRTHQQKPIAAEPGKPPAPSASDPAAPAVYYGPRPIGALVPALTKAAFRSHGWMVARLISEWHQIVGPALAAETVPLKVSGGTLTVACSGPVGLELQHLAPLLLARISDHLGLPVAERLRVVQHVVACRPSPVADAVEHIRSSPIAPPPETLDEALGALGAAIGRAGAACRRQSSSPRASSPRATARP